MQVYVDGSRKNGHGEYGVYISVNHNGKRFYVNTGLSSPTKFSGTAFPNSIPNSQAKTSRLMAIWLKIEEIGLRNPDLPPHMMKEYILAEIHGRPRTKRLTDYIQEFGNTRTAPGTRDLYKQTARKVGRFDATATFNSVDADWLARLEQYCRTTGMHTNGISIVLRNIRAVFNWAIDKELTTRYPFRHYRIKTETTRKRALTPEQFATLRDYPCEPWQVQYRDIFVLMVYLIGINGADLLQLRGLTDGRCVYHRQKTGRLYDIAVQPEAKEIIDRYKGRHWLLACLDDGRQYRTYMHQMDEALKKIGPARIIKDKCGKMRKVERSPLFPELTTYWARHTWATTAAKLDIPRDTIAKALGHADSMTADIYIDFDNKKIDEANRKVIDYLNGVRGQTP